MTKKSVGARVGREHGTLPAAPVSEASCFRLATAYLARRAASRWQLHRYLLRKIGSARAEETGSQAADAIVDAVLDRLERLQLIDDALLAQSRARTLAAKGFSGRRMRNHLAQQGFDISDRAVSPSLDVDDEQQAIRFAERKRLGPFATGTRQPSFARDMRALVRAGFGVDVATRVLRQAPCSDPMRDELDELDMNEP